MIRRDTLGIAAALILGWVLGAVMTHPLPAKASAPSLTAAVPIASFTGPNAARRPTTPPHRHGRSHR